MQAEIRTILKRFTRRLLLTRIFESAVLFSAGSAALCGLVMTISLITNFNLHFDLWVLPVLFISAGALAGFFIALFKGASVRQAAIFLDARYKLQERLTTAAEFSEENSYCPAVACIFDQAVTVARQIPARPSFRKNPPAISAALILGVLFCGLLSLIPDSEPKQTSLATDEIRQAVEVMNKMPPDSRAELARAISATPTKDEKIQAKLNALSRAIIAGNQAEQRRILAELRQAGYRPIAELPEHLQLELSQAGADKLAKASSLDNTSQQQPDENSKSTSASQPVRIYHPDYDTATSPPAWQTQETSQPSPADPAWLTTKALAARNAQPGKIPPSYQPIVRRFYQAGAK